MFGAAIQVVMAATRPEALRELRVIFLSHIAAVSPCSGFMCAAIGCDVALAGLGL